MLIHFCLFFLCMFFVVQVFNNNNNDNNNNNSSTYSNTITFLYMLRRVYLKYLN